MLATGVACAALLGSALPARAAGYNIGSDSYSRSTYNGRCEVSVSMAACLWYSYSSTESGIAYYAVDTNVDVPNLGTKYYSSSGSGHGQVVRNNSAALDCTVYTYDRCFSYYSPNYVGNYDYAYWGIGGRLNYTWNDNASLKLN